MKKFLYLIIAFAFACSSDKSDRNNFSIVKSPLDVKISGDAGKIKSGDSVNIVVTLNNDKVASSTELFLNDSLIAKPSVFPLDLKISTKGLKMGRNVVRISASIDDQVQGKSNSFILHADNAPAEYTYKVIRSIPHDEKAYTQGLFYHDGNLYEGTGQKGQSELRKLNINNGEVLNSVSLPDNFFGEGIALHNEKIYQLSWQLKTGFIYNLETFEEVQRFYYEGEGWGLTNDSKYFYRTDGSHKIHVHSLDDFSAKSVLEVYSDEVAIKWLNEVEYIDGKIYANIWQKDKIGIIDPKNGKLEGMINLKGLLPKKDKKATTDVLNGIAYDPSTGRLYLTGKNWPKIFEVEIIPAS